jgi:glyoxylase-like metal-dependent hydrolase (beta-lactamase superfamily II)
VFKDLGERIKQFEPGKEIVPGVNSVAAHGHTPGHTAFAVSSGGQTLLHIVDSANIAVFVKNPGWHVVFDANPAQAEASRRKLLPRHLLCNQERRRLPPSARARVIRSHTT